MIQPGKIHQARLFSNSIDASGQRFHQGASRTQAVGGRLTSLLRGFAWQMIVTEPDSNPHVAGRRMRRNLRVFFNPLGRRMVRRNDGWAAICEECVTRCVAVLAEQRQEVGERQKSEATQ
jgi:hypothetical protein